MLGVVVHCNALSAELVRSQLSMLFLSMFHAISKYNFLLFQTNFTVDAGETFVYGSIFN